MSSINAILLGYLTQFRYSSQIPLFLKSKDLIIFLGFYILYGRSKEYKMREVGIV